ncbi:hypothetical protein ACWIGM_03240 [Bosea sp. NPDC055332]
MFVKLSIAAVMPFASYYVARYLGGEFWLHLFIVLIAAQTVDLFLYFKDWRERAGADAVDKKGSKDSM